MKTDICIIGAGPAGVMASIYAAKSKAKILVVERNTTAGRKLLHTGRGRCNITNTAPLKDFIHAYDAGRKFLSYCLHECPPRKMMEFFQSRGLELKVEDNGCVFPVTDKASDVKKILLSEAESLGVRFLYGGTVLDINKSDEGFVLNTEKEAISSKKIIITTGGLSWPDTGSTGDGYQFAEKLGHKISPLKACLVPLITKENWPTELAGVGLEKVRISAVIDGKKVIASGPMLFTHKGIGGPAVFDFSRYITDFLPAKDKPINISIDLMADKNEADIEKEFLAIVHKSSKGKVVNCLSELIPKRLAAVLFKILNFDSNISTDHFSKDDRKRVVKSLKSLPLSIISTRDIKEATVTRGGVCREQIDPKTMQSLVCPGIFFAGEIIDVDGPCGGYNLQICWSTGALAGQSAAKSLEHL